MSLGTRSPAPLALTRWGLLAVALSLTAIGVLFVHSTMATATDPVSRRLVVPDEASIDSSGASPHPPSAPTQGAPDRNPLMECAIQLQARLTWNL